MLIISLFTIGDEIRIFTAFFPPPRSYVRNILSCQSASLVNSSAQQSCWRPLGQKMPTSRCELKERGRLAWRTGEAGVWHGFVSFHSTSSLISSLRRKQTTMQLPLLGGSSVSSMPGQCGRRTAERQRPQMPNKSTPKNSLKGDLPPTDFLCLFTWHTVKERKNTAVL